MGQTTVNRTLCTAAVSFVLCAPPASTQEPAKPVAVPASEKLAEWPKLADADKEKLLANVGQFRKADPKLHEAAHRILVSIGEPGMPLMFQQVSDQAQNVNPQLFAVFDEVCKPQHAALLARESKKNKVELRRYLMRRMCRFGDPDLLPVLKAAQQDKDPETAFFAALGALALKQKEALPAALAYCKTNWKDQGPLVAEVLPMARSNEVGAWVFEAIAKAGVPEQMTGLRLARYLAVKEQTVILRTYLQAPDHTVKKEAVNAMRVLHGEAPIENLDVFKSIEMAKKWLEKA